ncbi:MAG TPA: hypothetical protein VHD31_01245 [Candidatus Paceibacterota bacterium]|nr:hypothetical protein [Candidatus Paceibacterota bacterium]
MPFSIEESLKFGWEQTKAHSKVLFQILLTIFALQVVQAIIGDTIQHEMIGVLATIAVVIAETVVGIGLTLVTLKIAKHEHVSYGDIIPPLKLSWNYILATMLAALITAVGLILLIIPGIYFALRFSMVRFVILEGGGVMASLEKSGTLTQGIKWKLLGFFVVIALLNILGAILFMVGLLITIPVTMIAYAHVYQKLHARHHA